MTAGPPEQPTKCEWCGADYDPANPPVTATHPQPRPAAAAQAEPATHCEWCGAEYPVPEASPPS